MSTTITSATATALTVAASGTNYGFQVDESATSAATGLKITTAAAAAGLAVSTLSSGTNESLRIDAKGSGSVQISGVSTGDVTLATGGGSVGIGTLAPVGKLEVTGAAPQLLVRRPTEEVTQDSQLVFSTGSGVSADTNALAMIRAIITQADPSALKANMEFRTNHGDNLSAGMLLDDAGRLGLGTTTPGSTLHVIGGIQVGSPTGGDKGSGTINVSGDIYKNNTAYTNPDYVFEQYFGGLNSDSYGGMVPLEELEATFVAKGTCLR